MSNHTLYTAIGHFKKKADTSGQVYPVVLVNRQEYPVDMQEMMVWSTLCWRLMDYRQLQEKYELLTRSLEQPKYTLVSCVERLKTRGLISCGTGPTDFDALYDLLGDLYVMPLTKEFLPRLTAFLKLVLFNGVSYRSAKTLFYRDSPTQQEAQVISLARQALLSTAEIIKCIDIGVHDISTGSKLMDKLYCDPESNSDNIRYMVNDSPNKAPVTSAVANLYLRKQIIFERL